MGKRLTVMDKVMRAVEGASPAEIREASKHLREVADAKARIAFYPGQKVKAIDGSGRRLPRGAEGVVKTVNAKTITVDFGDYKIWRMYPSGLEAA